MRAVLLAQIGLLFGAIQMPAQQTIRIRLLSGDTGKAIIGARLLTITTSRNFEGGKITAAAMGDEYTIQLHGETSVGLGLVSKSESAWNQYRLCASGANLNPIYSVSVILASGLVAPNDCNHKISVRPQPGEMVFFLKRLSLWQRLRGSIVD